MVQLKRRRAGASYPMQRIFRGPAMTKAAESVPLTPDTIHASSHTADLLKTSWSRRANFVRDSQRNPTYHLDRAMATDGRSTNESTTSSDRLISPTELCHMVLRTTPENHGPMIAFYLTFLGARIMHRNERIAFMSYDHKDHRIAIIAIPGLQRPTPPESAVGLAHASFGFDTLQDLAMSYEQKKSRGIKPHWCVNHGMTTSMYYADPDGNGLEMQVDNFDSAEECVAFISSQSFATNPIGVDYDPEEFVRRVKAGGDEEEIKKRPDIGKRMTRMEKAGLQVEIAS